MQNRKRNGIYRVVAGLLMTVLVVLVILEIVSPNNVSLYMIPVSISIIIAWLYAYRVSRRTVSEEARSKMGNQKEISKQDLKIETRNAFLIMIGLAIIFTFAVIQLFVINSYDNDLTLSGIKSPLSLDYPSLVVLAASSWAWGLSIAQFWKLLKLKSSKT